MTPNIKNIMHEFDQKEFNYEFIFLQKEENFLTINL